jgi:hypothetical protein
MLRKISYVTIFALILGLFFIGQAEAASEVWFCSEADCSEITVTFGGVTSQYKANCYTLVGFTNVPAGTYAFSASGCGASWSGSISVNGTSNYYMTLCPSGVLPCCPAGYGCGEEGAFNCSECQGQGWGAAYEMLFDNSSDLELFRQYRDEFLIKSAKGKLYTKLLYKGSEEALGVLLDNLGLMLRAKKLIEANKDAVAEVVSGNTGVIYDTDAIVSFLDAYARKCPASLKLLVTAVKDEMLEKQKQGERFGGFELR